MRLLFLATVLVYINGSANVLATPVTINNDETKKILDEVLNDLSDVKKLVVQNHYNGSSHEDSYIPDVTEVNKHIKAIGIKSDIRKPPRKRGVHHGTPLRVDKWQPVSGKDFVVPYRFSSPVTRSVSHVKAINEGIKLINGHLKCGGLRKHTGQRDYIEFIIGNGCYSYLGKIGGNQSISIGYGCQYKGIVAHEILHALGFGHEQSRPDRDKYIKINWENIQGGRNNNNFRKAGLSEYLDLKSPYDYNSVMHYGRTAFSINGEPTIIARNNRKRELGQRDGLSKIDIKELNDYFNCEQEPTTKPKTTKKPTTVSPPVPKGNILAKCDFRSHCGFRGLSRNPLSWNARVIVPGESGFVAQLMLQSGSMYKFINKKQLEKSVGCNCRERNKCNVKYCVSFQHMSTGGKIFVGLRIGKRTAWKRISGRPKWKTSDIDLEGRCSSTLVIIYGEKSSFVDKVYIKDLNIRSGSCA